MRRNTILLSVLLGSLAPTLACGPELLLVDVPGERTPYVVNGQPYSGHPSAGLLTVSGALCTATLVGKKTVLTAAHCVSPGATHTFKLEGVSYQSVSAKQHPQYNSYQITNDVAVVILKDAPPVTPATVNVAVPTVGLELTIVGFGKTSEYANDVGVKRMAKAKVSQITTQHVVIPPSNAPTAGNICNGDSGGPSYAIINGVDVQVGVHSTKSGACGDGGNDVRVDKFIDWITQTAGGDVVTPGAPPPPTTPPPPPPPGTSPPPVTPPPAGPDTQAPTVAITYPPSGAKVAASLGVIANIADNVGVAKVELLLDGAVVSSASGTAASYPVVLKPGTHTLQLVAYDAAGNKGQATVSATVDAGATPTPPPTTPPPTTPPPTTPPPATKGAFGETCVSKNDCQSGLCADDQGAKYCTESCGPAKACPSGAECLKAGALYVCALPPGVSPTPPTAPGGNGAHDDQLVGSCSLAGGAGDLRGGWWLALALGVLGLRRRRSRVA